MRFLARLLGLTSLLAAGLIYLRITSMRTAVLWPLKVVATGAASVAALLGGIAALLGWRNRDGQAVVIGAVGAAMTTYYIAKVTTETDSYDEAFGDDWRARIPVLRRRYMLPHRLSARMPTTHDPRVEFDVPYYTPDKNEPRTLRCDVWQPPWDVRPSGLTYVYTHGGGWHYGYKDFNTRPLFRHLAAQGHVVVDIDYRLAPEVQLETMLADIKRAIIWVKAHSEKYDINPERIVLAGGSSGAHIALLAAYTANQAPFEPDDMKGDTSVRAVVAFYPPVDIYALYQYGASVYDDRYPGKDLLVYMLKQIGLLRPEEMFITPPNLMSGLLGGTPDDVPERYAQASPLAYVGDHCPPTLLLHGQDDSLVGVHHSRILRNALQANGVDVALVEYALTDHGFDLASPDISPSAQAAFYDLERFLALME